MRKHKILFVLLLVAALVFGSLPAAAQYSLPFELTTPSVFMVNVDTGEVMYEKNADDEMAPASLTKIMTAILALENIEDLDNTRIALKLSIQDTLYGTNATLGGIYQNEEVTARGLLYAALLQSANEAAMMLGDYLGDGSMAQFYEMMNEKAREIGCTNTNFASANGLEITSADKANKTTARDMAKIAAYAMQNPEFVKMVNTASVDIGPTSRQESLWEYTTNKMINPGSDFYYPAASGIKTGTLEGFRCYATQASKDGFTYLVVLLGTPYDPEDPTSVNTIFEESADLFDWAFSNFQVKTLLEKGRYVVDIPVNLSFDKDVVGLISAERFTSLIPTDIEVSSVQLLPDVPESIDAPIKKGDELGTVRLMLAGEEVGRVPLVANETIEMSTLLYYWSKVTGFFGSFWFKFGFIFVILLIVTYAALMVIRNRNQRRYGGSPRKRRGGGRMMRRRKL